MTVSVEDHDLGQNAHVGISISGIVDGRGQERPHYFHIDDHGVIVTNTAPRNLDRETMDTYKLTVVLIDSGTPFLKTTGTVTVVLGDINDNTPQFAEKLVRYEVHCRCWVSLLTGVGISLFHCLTTVSIPGLTTGIYIYIYACIIYIYAGCNG